MKSIKYNILKQHFLLVIMLVAVLFMSSCASRYAFNTSSVVPAAEGSVKVKSDKNNNYSIELSVDRLAEPERLSSPREMYIVWMETEQNGTKNIGQLKTSSGLLSNSLKSSLKTVSSFKPTAFFITAEDYGDVQYPSGQEVLRTNPF